MPIQRLLFSFNIESIVRREFVPRGYTVDRVFYKDVLIRSRERIREKRLEKWQRGSRFPRHDNAPAHTALSIREFSNDKKKCP